MTNEELAKIRERCERATEGPWRISGDIDHLVCAEEDPEKYDGPSIVADCGNLYNASNSFHIRQMQDNADFIARTRTDIPALLDTIDELKAKNTFYKTSYKKRLEVESEIAEMLGMEVDCGILERIASKVREMTTEIDELKQAAQSTTATEMR